MNWQIFIAVLGILGAPVTLLVQWFLNRRKDGVDVTAGIAGASQDAVETMQQVMVELKEQVALLKEENKELKKQVAQLDAEVRRLRAS
jgi:predicted RNase H-like nuclease (RuvC/YqgF family)